MHNNTYIDYLDDNGLPTILHKEKVAFGAQTWLSVWPRLVNDGILNLLKSGFAPSQSQTKLGNLGWVGGGTCPQSQGCGAGVCSHPPPPSSSTPFLLPLQIPCSLVVAKLL